MLDATVGKVLRYAAENLTNLPTFSLQALQGVLQAGRFVKDVALELQLDQVRTPEEYNQALAERFKKWDAAVQAAQNMSPEQIKDMACRFAADILTLEGLARAAEYARSSAVGSHGNAPVDGQVVKPVQKALTVEAEGRSATSQTTPRKEGAPTVRTERSRPASSVPVVKEETVVTVPAKHETGRQSTKLVDSAGVNQTGEAILKNGYWEVNGFKFSDYYYNKLWTNGREAPSLIAKEILDHAPSCVPDIKPGFYRYTHGGWELVYNPQTKEIWHIQPTYKK